MALEEVASSVASGAIAGAVYSLAGYFNNKVKEKETLNTISFDAKNFFVTVVGAAFVGGIAGYTGMPFDVLMTGATGVAVTQVLRKVFNVGMKLIGA